MMDLEPYGDRDDDAWVATGPRYPWGGLYGGQIVAQGLMAAALTVDEEFQVHSLHASFIRSGSHTEKNDSVSLRLSSMVRITNSTFSGDIARAVFR